MALCDSWLTRPFSVIGLHGVRLQNGLDFWILRAKVTINHVPHARKRIFDSGDLSWPDLDPDPYLVWRLCSHGIFTSPLRLLWPSFEQKTINITDPRFRHTETSKFDSWPDLDPRLKVNLRILSMHWKDLVESFRTPPRGASIRPLVLKITGGGVGSDPPGGSGYGNSPDGDGLSNVIIY